MTLTLPFGPVTGHRIGPGMTLGIENDIPGPIPVDDYIIAWVDWGVGVLLVDGFADTQGGYFVGVTLGVHILQPDGFNVSRGGISDGQPDNATCTFHAEWHHRNGVLVDSVTVANMHWDPTSAMHELNKWYGGPFGDATQRILAAVTRVFPANA